MSSAPPKPTLGILEDHTSSEFKQWSLFFPPKMYLHDVNPPTKNQTTKGFWWFLNGFLTQLTWFKRRSAPATWSPVLGGVQWPEGRPSTHFQSIPVMKIAEKLRMLRKKQKMNYLSWSSMGCTQSLHCWWWSKAHTRKISRTEAICKSVGLSEPNNNEKMCQKAEKRNKDSSTLTFGGWKMKRAHSHLKHVCSLGKATVRSRASMKVAQEVWNQGAIFYWDLCSPLLTSHSWNKQGIFSNVAEKKKHIEFIESKHIEIFQMSTNQGSHLPAAASRGIREWIHALLPVHSLPQMGASKPMNSLRMQRMASFWTNRSWVAQPNRSQWHPQTATTPCFPPWPPTQKRRATRRKWDAAEKKKKLHLLV